MPEVRGPLFAYMAGILKNLEVTPYLINGMPDHVHILARLRPKLAVSDVLRDVKSDSSEWFHKTYRRTAFAWQEGYGAFTVSPTEKQRVFRYIENQQEHHRHVGFQEEYVKMLQLAEIEYDPKFVFD